MDQLERLQHALADRYRLEHELGRGGMATVYLAQDLKHDRRVALKVMRPEIAPAHPHRWRGLPTYRCLTLNHESWRCGYSILSVLMTERTSPLL